MPCIPQHNDDAKELLPLHHSFYFVKLPCTCVQLCLCGRLVLSRYMGTITGLSDLDPVRWPNSHWRSVKVIDLMCRLWIHNNRPVCAITSHAMLCNHSMHHFIFSWTGIGLLFCVFAHTQCCKREPIYPSLLFF